MQNKQNGHTAMEGQGRGNTSRRGFASMDIQKQREIASKGGKAAHLSGNAHQFTSEEARKAGSKGGQARNANRMANKMADKQE
ncbi:MAG TPA: KGG domain-containing protein [Chitinophaga sp.]|nr:KGG domain-containing protein [Chitinophaga sp.]